MWGKKIYLDEPDPDQINMPENQGGFIKELPKTFIVVNYKQKLNMDYAAPWQCVNTAALHTTKRKHKYWCKKRVLQGYISTRLLVLSNL